MASDLRDDGATGSGRGRVYQRLEAALSLPMFPKLEPDEIEYVIDSCQEWAQRAGELLKAERRGEEPRWTGRQTELD